VTASSSPAPKPTPRPARHASGGTSSRAEPPTTPITKSAAATAARAATSQPGTAASERQASAASSNGRHAAEPSVGKLVSDASTHLSTLIRGEIELAKLELRSTVKNAGTGIGLFAGAAVVLVFSLIFAFLTLAEGIAALGLDRWLAFLIVFVFQLLIVGLFVWIGIKKVKKVKAPRRTIKSTRDTVDYLKKSRG
jgi:uncharacterized membrane protein YqjE